MQRLKGRSVLFGALAVLACSGDPTGNESTPTAITASPEVVFVAQGDSEPVIVSVIDEDGQVLQSDFTATNVGSGISVVFDPTFQEVTVGNPIRRQSRFFVKGVDLAHSSFTLNALGLTKDIEVFSVPGELDAEITDSLPVLGDTISIIAPAGTFFTAASSISFNGAIPFIVSQDATTITFIPQPNTDGPAVVTDVGVASNPAVTFDLATPFRVKTDSITDIGTAVTPTSPALGAPVTLTLPAGLRLIPESLLTLNLANQPILPRDVVLSADSSTITFVPPPNADSFVVVSGVIPQRLAACCNATRIIGTDTIPGYALTLGTTVKLTSAVVADFPSTVGNATPAANDIVTLTSSDADFAIADTATVIAGGVPATVTGRTANSISFVPVPGATGAMTVSGVVVSGFPLSLPSTATITVGPAPTAAGTNDPTTAPALDTPGAGETTVLFDLPDFSAVTDPDTFGPSAFYQIVIPADGDYTITTNWDIGSDIDQILCVSPIEPDFDCDITAAVSNHPESATYTLTAGTYVVWISDFGGDAAGATLQITVEH